jgi:hypothetical protein
MKLYYQLTTGDPDDYKVLDSSDWTKLGRFTMHAMCVQGVVFEGCDHYSAELVGRELKVYEWNDDPVQWPAGTRTAREVTFHDLAPDAAMGGAINTSQSQVIYAEGETLTKLGSLHAGSKTTILKPWTDFDPRRVNPKDGVMVTDELHEAHRAARTVHSWREWTEGLDPSELDDKGLVKSQREQGRYKVPDGTITYFINNPTDNTAVHTILSGNDRSLELVQGTPQLMFGGNLGINSDDLYAQHTTVANQPNFAQWPTGIYRCQIDVDTAGAGLTYGYTTAGASVGHFGRINAAGTSDLETHQQVEALASGTGIKLFTTGSVSWSAGAAGDRFEVLLACARDGVGHGNESMNILQGDVDSFADGPWVTGVAVPGDTPFIGANF